MHPLLLRCVAGGAGGLAAGPGAVPVADEPHGGQENLETSPSGMIIIDDMEENEKYSAKEAEEPSSRAGQGKVEIQTSDHDSSSSDRCCPSPAHALGVPLPPPLHLPSTFTCPQLFILHLHLVPLRNPTQVARRFPESARYRRDHHSGGTRRLYRQRTISPSYR